MLTNNMPIRPDKDGDFLQQIAAQIAALDMHAICPRDSKEARAMLAKLQERTAPRESESSRRLNQVHEVYNGLLPMLAKAKRFGLRPADTKPPALPVGGEASPDQLHEMQEFAQQLDIDVADWEAHTPDQRRIAQIAAKLNEEIKQSNLLVKACAEYEERIARLEAIISGPRAA